jgi:hypothetical protein
MNKLWVRHVRDAINSGFADIIPLDDYSNASPSAREKAFLSRALAALAVQRFTAQSPEEAAETVVDGSGDNGIDAVAVDETNGRVILVQSKWDGSGNRTLGLGDARNFIAGFHDLLDLKFERFTHRLQAKQAEITAALDNPDVKFTLVVATTGPASLALPVKNAFDDCLNAINETQPTVELEILGLAEFHSAISEGLSGPKIDLSVTLENWGTLLEPYEAYYGVVSGAQLVQWYEDHGDRLFSQNLRKSLGTTGVNEQVADTANKEPEHFWYFNNGVTALCESVRKTARGATSRTYGNFTLTGVSVVNGAQTVASISRAAKRNPESIEGVRVWLRFISLEGCPPDFGSEVTRATNTQNNVEARDFVALDHEQSRLRTELVLTLHKTYSIKRGEAPPEPETGCTVVDATVALACANRDVQLTVLAKSKVGSLWESTEKPPYRLLFNAQTGPYRVWRCVHAMRLVDSTLNGLQVHLDGRSRSIARQGNRLILHLVFRELRLDRIDDPDFDWDRETSDIPERTERALSLLIQNVESLFPGSYVTSLFKNITKCRQLTESIREQMLDSSATERVHQGAHST